MKIDPGPKPEDYLLIGWVNSRRKNGDPWIYVEQVTHYLNHGNEWTSAPVSGKRWRLGEPEKGFVGHLAIPLSELRTDED